MYYDLFNILDDVDMFTDAIKQFTKTKYNPYYIKLCLEYLRLNNFEYELNVLYDMRINDLKDFRDKWLNMNSKKQLEFDFGDY